jgi:hypothetical protein
MAEETVPGGGMDAGTPDPGSYSDIGGEQVEPGEQSGVETFPEPAGGVE